MLNSSSYSIYNKPVALSHFTLYFVPDVSKSLIWVNVGKKLAFTQVLNTHEASDLKFMTKKLISR